MVHTRPDKLGDHVWLIPVLRSLYDQTGCHITVISSEVVAPFLRLFDFIAEILVIDINAPTSHWLSPTIQTIKSRKIGIWVSCWNHPTMARLAFQSRIPVRIGDGSIFPWSYCYTHRVPQDWRQPLRHQLDYYDSMMAPLGVKAQWRDDFIPVSSSERAVFNGYYHGVTQPKLFIFLETGGTNRPIPLPTIRAMIPDLLKQGYHLTVCATTAHDGFPAPVLNMTGKGLSIGSFIGLISHCDYYIGGDTAATHLASWLQKPILFFSPMKNHSPARWGPLSPYQVIVRKEYRCPTPCQPHCDNGVCLQWATPDRLLTALKALDAATKGPPLPLIGRYHTHSVHTLRCLRMQCSSSPGYTLTQAIEQGHVVFTLTIQTQWWTQLKGILTHFEACNINVLLGPIPALLRWVITGYIGIIRRQIPPVHWDSLATVAVQLATKAMVNDPVK